MTPGAGGGATPDAAAQPKKGPRPIPGRGPLVCTSTTTGKPASLLEAGCHYRIYPVCTTRSACANELREDSRLAGDCSRSRSRLTEWGQGSAKPWCGPTLRHCATGTRKYPCCSAFVPE
jgi:hypothetical protein